MKLEVHVTIDSAQSKSEQDQAEISWRLESFNNDRRHKADKNSKMKMT